MAHPFRPPYFVFVVVVAFGVGGIVWWAVRKAIAIIFLAMLDFFGIALPFLAADFSSGLSACGLSRRCLATTWWW